MIEPEPIPRRALPVRVQIAIVPGLVFIGLLGFGLSRSGSQAESGSEGPSFQLPLLDGSGLLTDEDLKGKPVVVNFWASWCIPCREEAPLLEETWRAFKDEGVIFVGVNIKDAESDAKRFVEKFGITYPTVRDPDGSLTESFGVTGLPETFFLDHSWIFIGAISGDQTGDQQGTVILGAISRDELISNIEILLSRAQSSREADLESLR